MQHLYIIVCLKGEKLLHTCNKNGDTSMVMDFLLFAENFLCGFLTMLDGAIVANAMHTYLYCCKIRYLFEW